MPPPRFIEPASSSVKDVTKKSGVERPWSATANGVRLAMSMTKTSETGRTALDKVGTSSVWFGEAVDGNRLPLSLPLSKQLLEKGFVFGIRDT